MIFVVDLLLKHPAKYSAGNGRQDNITAHVLLFVQALELMTKPPVSIKTGDILMH